METSQSCDARATRHTRAKKSPTAQGRPFPFLLLFEMRTTDNVDAPNTTPAINDETSLTADTDEACVEATRAASTETIEQFDTLERTLIGVGNEIDAYEAELRDLVRFGLRVNDALVRLHAQRQRVNANIAAAKAQRTTMLALMLRDITDRMATALERCIPVNDEHVARIRTHRETLRAIAADTPSLESIGRAIDVARAVLQNVRADAERIRVCVADAEQKRGRHLDVGDLAETLRAQQRELFASYEACCDDLSACATRYLERGREQTAQLLADVRSAS